MNKPSVQTVVAPIFLSKHVQPDTEVQPETDLDGNKLDLDEPAEDEGAKLILDVHASAHHVVVTRERAKKVDRRPKGIQSLGDKSGLEPNKVRASNSFEALFGGHREIFAPLYGTVDDIFEVFRSWTFAHLLRSFLPVRPIGIFTGPPGSTKSSTAAAIGQIWYGSKTQAAHPIRVPDNQRDLIGLFAHNPYVIFDNVEAAPAWFADSLCVAVTEGMLSTRELFTTAGVYSVCPDAFIAVTSFSATGVTRGDLLDRSLIFPMARACSIGSGDWAEKVRAHRTGIWQQGLEVVRNVLRAREHLPLPRIGDVPASMPVSQSDYVVRDSENCDLGGSKSNAGWRLETNTPTVGFDPILSALTLAGSPLDRLRDFVKIGEVIAASFDGELGCRRFKRGMAACALMRMQVAITDPYVEPLVLLASRADAESTWYTSTDLLRACGEALGAERGFDMTGRSAEGFGRWLSAVNTRAPGVLHVDYQFKANRRLYRLQCPAWVQVAADVLRVPAVEEPDSESVSESEAFVQPEAVHELD